MEITMTVLLCSPHSGEVQASTRVFRTMSKGLSELVDWLSLPRVTAVVLEALAYYGASALRPAAKALVPRRRSKRRSLHWLLPADRPLQLPMPASWHWQLFYKWYRNFKLALLGTYYHFAN